MNYEMQAEVFLTMRGYRRCDIVACNCGSWHGGFADERLLEIANYIRECGMWKGTILDSVKFMARDVCKEQ